MGVVCTCLNCGKIFKIIPARARDGRGKFCSMPCKKEYRDKYQRETKTCEICGKQFVIKKSQARRGGRNSGRFCSRECMAKWQIEYFADNNPKSVELIKLTCSYCGKEYKTYPAWVRKRIKQNCKNSFCSDACSRAYHTKQNSTNWQGGISFAPYCEKFDEYFKERTRAFFKYECVLCGAPQNGKALDVHHVDYNKMMCCDRSDRLVVALCSRCHPKTNFHRSYWRLYFRELIALQYGGKCYYTKEEMAAITSPAEIIPLQPLQQISGQIEQRIPTSSPQQT